MPALCRQRSASRGRSLEIRLALGGGAAGRAWLRSGSRWAWSKLYRMLGRQGKTSLATEFFAGEGVMPARIQIIFSPILLNFFSGCSIDC